MKKSLFILALCLLFVQLGFAQTKRSNPKASERVKVSFDSKVVSTNNTPITQAQFSLYKESKFVANLTSDSQGKFKGSLDTGTYQYQISCLNYKPASGILIVKNTGCSPSLFKLVPIVEMVVNEKDKALQEIVSEPVITVPKRERHVIHKRKNAQTINGSADKHSDAELKANYGGIYNYDKQVGARITSSNYLVEKEPQSSTNEFKRNAENKYIHTYAEPVSTFSIDVDNASYAIVRQSMVQGNYFPNPDAVRVEEMINAFQYNYPTPQKNEPLAVNTELASCPWAKDHQLLRISMQAKTLDLEKAPANNLVFLIDVSGSMSYENKLPLVKEGLKLLVANLREEDKLSIVVYAGAAGLVLSPTSGANKTAIYEALDRLSAGGSTAGGAGINLAYQTAKANFLSEGNNRIILCSDGDFNVGISSETDLEQLVENKRKEGVYFSVLGFGMGNYKDNRMEVLADKGNGNYAYIDNIKEAKKRLVDQMQGTLYTVAKDVKFQVEFNPALVGQYRLVGYENRMLNNQDFKDDTKDAGELGAGHTVTALYEIIAPGADGTDPVERKYAQLNPVKNAKHANELATVRVRYKNPDSDRSKQLDWVVNAGANDFEESSPDMRFCSAVASFGQVLRKSANAGTATYQQMAAWVKPVIAGPFAEERQEFYDLLQWAITHQNNVAEVQQVGE